MIRPTRPTFQAPARARALAAALALAAAGGAAHAQALEPNAAVNAASQVTQLIDAGRLGEVYDGASPVARKLVAKDRFSADVAAARQGRGAPTAREWSGITRRQVAGSPTLPAGTYVNVEYETRFTSGPAATELVSFRLDEDRTWRLTGYFLK